MLKIRRYHDRLIFNMRIPIPVKDGLYTGTGPWTQLRGYQWYMPYIRYRIGINIHMIIMRTIEYNVYAEIKKSWNIIGWRLKLPTCVLYVEQFVRAINKQILKLHISCPLCGESSSLKFVSMSIVASRNSLLPSEAIWLHRFGSVLVQVMTCCQMCWLIIKGFLRHSHQSNFRRSAHKLNLHRISDVTFFKLLIISHREQWSEDLLPYFITNAIPSSPLDLLYKHPSDIATW